MKAGPLTIVKIGGALLENTASRGRALDAFVSIPGARVLVHGGGAAATALAARLGLPTHMVDGRRVTDRDMLDVVTMVYGGLIGRTVAAELQARGCNAVSLSGADLDILRARRRAAGAVDYGFVGDISRVGAGMLRTLLDLGAVPVIAPLTHDGHGALLNTNADTIAASVASVLAPERPVSLYYCFDRDGVLDDEGRVLSSLTPGEADRLQHAGTISSGMLPKISNAFDALRAGVDTVLFCGLDGLRRIRETGAPAGTELRL